jgi:hypothetical protein
MTMELMRYAEYLRGRQLWIYIRLSRDKLVGPHKRSLEPQYGRKIYRWFTEMIGKAGIKKDSEVHHETLKSYSEEESQAQPSAYYREEVLDEDQKVDRAKEKDLHNFWRRIHHIFTRVTVRARFRGSVFSSVPFLS